MKPLSGWWPVQGLRRPEPVMSLPRTVADVIREHVSLERECLDRMYLNVYQPSLQPERDVFRSCAITAAQEPSRPAASRLGPRPSSRLSTPSPKRTISPSSLSPSTSG